MYVSLKLTWNENVCSKITEYAFSPRVCVCALTGNYRGFTPRFSPCLSAIIAPNFKQ